MRRGIKPLHVLLTVASMLAMIHIFAIEHSDSPAPQNIDSRPKLYGFILLRFWSDHRVVPRASISSLSNFAISRSGGKLTVH